MELRSTGSRLRFLLADLLTKLDGLSEEKQFFESIETIKGEITEILQLKLLLKKNYKQDQLENLDFTLNLLAKQIQEKFDNIIEAKKQEMTDVSKQIKNLQNSKNLAFYR